MLLLQHKKMMEPFNDSKEEYYEKAHLISTSSGSITVIDTTNGLTKRVQWKNSMQMIIIFLVVEENKYLQR